MKTGPWVRIMISSVVGCIALLAVLMFTGCAGGILKGDQCDKSQERSFGVLSALLTTVMGLAIKLDALEPAETASRNQTAKTRSATPRRPKV